ncbi:hypothetical protein D9M68_798170 [compost metagenome]
MTCCLRHSISSGRAAQKASVNQRWVRVSSTGPMPCSSMARTTLQTFSLSWGERNAAVDSRPTLSTCCGYLRA